MWACSFAAPQQLSLSPPHRQPSPIPSLPLSVMLFQMFGTISGRHHKSVDDGRQVILLTLTIVISFIKWRGWASLAVRTPQVWKSNEFYRCARSPFDAWKPLMVRKNDCPCKTTVEVVKSGRPFHLRKTLTLQILTFRNDSKLQRMSHCWIAPSHTSFRCFLATDFLFVTSKPIVLSLHS